MEQQAFDRVAAAYDATFTRRRLGRWLRSAVWERLSFAPGDHVLELGCGTGEDAIWLARQGVHVTATDISSGMLQVAQAKATAAGVASQIDFAQLDAGREWPKLPGLPAQLDGAFSNFGALNCLAQRRTLAVELAQRIRPGGRLVLVLMGPFCAWEIAWHLAHGEINTARRRWRSGATAHVGAGATLQVWYPAPQQLRAEFAPAWQHVETVGIGALLPPAHLAHLAERWPRTFETLALIERRFRHTWPWTWLNDHYLVVFERRN